MINDRPKVWFAIKLLTLCALQGVSLEVNPDYDLDAMTYVGEEEVRGGQRGEERGELSRGRWQ